MNEINGFLPFTHTPMRCDVVGRAFNDARHLFDFDAFFRTSGVAFFFLLLAKRELRDVSFRIRVVVKKKMSSLLNQRVPPGLFTFFGFRFG